MPRSDGEEPSTLETKVQAWAELLLLPLFFATTGLRMRLPEGHALGGTQVALDFALVLMVAIVGKVLGTAVAARACRMPWRDSLSMGALMNTRGLVELVILTIGLDLAVISPSLFALMVGMALVTTVMTTPLLSRLQRI